MFDKFGEMFQSITVGGIFIALAIIAAIVFVAILIAKYRAKKSKNHPQPTPRIRSASTAIQQIKKLTESQNGPPISEKAESETPVSDEESPEITGEFPAYIIRLDGTLDSGVIDKALGDVFTAEPSMPKSGACYFVREVLEGDVVKSEAYDPRTAPLASDLTPVAAWFATHWDIVKQVFAVPTQWWKSTSLWIAGIAGLLAFIVVMATIGG